MNAREKRSPSVERSTSSSATYSFPASASVESRTAGRSRACCATAAETLASTRVPTAAASGDRWRQGQNFLQLCLNMSATSTRKKTRWAKPTGFLFNAEGSSPSATCAEGPMAERRPLREAGAPCWSALVCRHERIVAAWRQAGTLGEGSARSGLSDTYGRVLYSANCGCQAPIGLVAHATTPTAEYRLALPQVAENEGEIRAIRVQLRDEPCGVAVGGEKLNDGFEVEDLVLAVDRSALGAAVWVISRR